MIPCHLCHHGTTNPQTCDPCITRILRHLTDVEHRTFLAPLELVARGAAATPPDPTGTRHSNDGLPALLVLMGPGSTAWHTDNPAVDSVLGVLQRYDNDWRSAKVFDEPATRPATVTRCALYLRQRLNKAAQHLDPTLVREFRDDIRRLHHQLQAAFKDGPQYSDVPCLNDCGRKPDGKHRPTLARVAPNGNGHLVEWRCDYCHTTYTADQWLVAVRAYGAPV